MATGEQIMDIKRKETLDRHGITEWHNRGYTGEGINFLYVENDDEHSAKVIETFKMVAPGANVYAGRISARVSSNGLEYCNLTEYDGTVTPFDEFVKTNNIHVVGNSTTATLGGPTLSEYFGSIPTIYIGAAGNNADSGISGSFYGFGIMIGAVDIINGEMSRAYYSAIDNEVDFCALHGAYTGTSFAQPVVSGLACLILECYGPMDQEEMYTALQYICEDLGNSGKDPYYGWGLPVLPERIDIFEKIRGDDKLTKVIELQSGKDIAVVDGDTVVLDEPPTIINGRMMVPLRFVSEQLGYSVDYEHETKKVTLKK